MIMLTCCLPEFLAAQARSGSYTRIAGIAGKDVELLPEGSSSSASAPFDSHFRGTCLEYEYAGKNISFILGGESVSRSFDLHSYYRSEGQYWDHWYNHEYEVRYSQYKAVSHHLGIGPGVMFHPWGSNRFCQFAFGSGIWFHRRQNIRVSEDSYYSAEVWDHYNQQTYEMTTYYSNVVNSTASDKLEMNRQKWRSSVYLECRVNFRLAYDFFLGLETGRRLYTAQLFSPNEAYSPDYGNYLRMSLAWKFSDRNQKAETATVVKD